VKHAFVSGEPALDFVGSLKWRRDDQEELLLEPSDLRDWAVEGGIVSAEFDVDTSQLSDALQLREAVYSAVRAVMAETPIAASDTDLLNRFSAFPPVQPQLVDMQVRFTGDASAVLSTVARNAVSVILDDSVVLKECASERCTRIFADRSRGARRNWCGMDECGNRVKAAAYRRRIRGEEPVTTPEVSPPAFKPSCIMG